MSNANEESKTNHSPKNQLFWNVANFFTVPTAATIISSILQTPIKNYLMRNLASEKPPHSLDRNFAALTLIRTLYRGNNFFSSYFKNLFSQYNEKTPDESQITNTGLIAASSMSMLLAGTEAHARLKGIGRLPDNFAWIFSKGIFHDPKLAIKNSRQLWANGFIARFGSGFIAMKLILDYEAQIAAALPIKDKTFQHFSSGAIVGIILGITTYPLNGFRDALLVKAQVKDGELYTVRSIELCQQLLQQYQEDPQIAARAFLKKTKGQLPLRTVGSMIGMTLLCGLGEKLGPRPLAALENRLSNQDFLDREELPGTKPRL